MLKSSRTLFPLLTLFLAGNIFAQTAPAMLREGFVTMPTYGFDDPNPVPTPEGLCYPYFRYDGFSTGSEQKQWKTVELENQWIKVTIFPEIGGKVWGAVDKTAQKEFIYYNHVVKFRDIALRGAWVSGGIEFNFGVIGHAPTSAVPVDYTTKVKPDGSVSCYVSSFELLTRTFWTVEINLPKDKAYFTTHTTWHNASGVEQPYYHWMNAAYHSSPETEFCFPGDRFIAHDGIPHSFPLDEEGRNLSYYKNNAFGPSKAYHVLGYYNDFYGSYMHEDGFGSVHYSPYDEKLGMKIFLWSQARDGAIWEDLLTDNDGQYVELQSGKLFNQPGYDSSLTPFKNRGFRPAATDQWTEYWYPVKDTKGLVESTPAGSLNIQREGTRVHLYFSPLSDITEVVKVETDGKVIYSESIDFKTLTLWKKELSAPEGSSIKVTIGDHLLSYSDAKEDHKLDRPMTTPKDFDWDSAYGEYVAGQEYLRTRRYTLAEKAFTKSIEKEKYFAPALVELASIYYRWGRYEDALSLTSQALSLNAYDPEANYLYGLANFTLGRFTDAKDGLSIAAHDPLTRSAAYQSLAGVYIHEGDLQEAILLLKKSLAAGPNNLSAKHCLIACYRKSGLHSEALALIDEVLSDLPLAYGIRYERALLEPDYRKTFLAGVGGELPAQTFMELSSQYEQMGLTQEAIDLLDFIPQDPVALCRKAWLGQSEKALSKLPELSVEMAFPFRGENLRALQWAAQHSTSWKGKYLLALAVHFCGDRERALSLLEECEDSDFGPMFLYRASLRSGEAKLADIQKAEKLWKDWRIGRELIRYYEHAQDYSSARNVAERYYNLFPESNTLGFLYGKTLCENGEYEASISLFKRITILPSEGSYEGQDAYRKANLLAAMDCLRRGNTSKALKYIGASKLWPENLGVGKPYEDLIDYRLEDYLEGIASVHKPLSDSDAQRLNELTTYLRASLTNPAVKAPW